MIGKTQNASNYNDQTAGSVGQISGLTRHANQENSTRSSNSKTSRAAEVNLSKEAVSLYERSQKVSSTTESELPTEQLSLTTEELKEVAQLKSIDREVRTHEQAHMMVGGNLVRKGASYQYEMGPDGVRYAVSGEVSIDASPVDGDPAATIAKMQKVKRAALAPAEPSPQDRSVAASASQKEFAARRELAMQSVDENA